LNWPFVEAESDAEGPGHVRMKNMAVFFLRTMGYSLDKIQTEYHYDRGWIDIAVERDDGTIVGVECETQESASVSNMRIVKDDHRLFALRSSELYQVAGQGRHREKIQVQLTLGGGRGEVGRWFDDGREYTTRTVHPKRRRQRAASEYCHSTPAPEDYNRWCADGEPKQEGQPLVPGEPDEKYERFQ
jgi:hypothetical protein